MADALKPIQSIRYKTYLMKALVQAMRPIFEHHPDETTLRDTNVTLEMPLTQQQYPSVVVRFYERDFKNMGVGHSEMIESVDSNGMGTGRYQKYRHFLYHGDVEFAIYALSSYDRDLVSDTIVQTITMGDTEAYTNAFLARLLAATEAEAPGASSHCINVNTDSIQGFGATTSDAPWGSEDKKVYSSAYRVNISGEVYSRTQPLFDYGLVERVEPYPYMTNLDPVPNPWWSGPNGIHGDSDDRPDPAPWV